jgi:hypothetical protein
MVVHSLTTEYKIACFEYYTLVLLRIHLMSGIESLAQSEKHVCLVFLSKPQAVALPELSQSGSHTVQAQGVL